MSAIDIFGLAASATQLADTGLKLSVDLLTFTCRIKPTDGSVNALPYDVDFVDDLPHRIAATSAVLRQLGHALTDQQYGQLCSSQAAATTQELLDDCAALFEELLVMVGPVAANNLGDRHARSSARVINLKRKLNFTYLQSQVVELRVNLDRLKSGFLVVFNLLILADHVRRQEAAPMLKDQQDLLKLLVEENATHEKRYLDVVGPNMGRNHPDSEDDDSNEPVVSPFQVQIADAVDVTGTTQQEKSERTIVKAEKHEIPQRLRYSYRQILDSGELVESLLQEINSTKYKIDPNLRSTLHNHVLDCHWDSWFGMRSVHGTQVFIDCYSDLEEVARFWSDQKSFDDRDKKEVQDRMKKNEFTRGLWEEYANNQPRRRVPPAVKDSFAVDNSEPLLDGERPTWIRIHRNHILPETLNAYHLKWEYDSADHHYIIIKEYIDRMLQRELFAHTKKLLRQMTQSVTKSHAKETADVGELAGNGMRGGPLESIAEEDGGELGDQMRVQESQVIDGKGPKQMASPVDGVQSNTQFTSAQLTSNNQEGSTNVAPDPVVIKSPLTPSWASDNGDDYLSIDREGKRADDKKDTTTATVTGANIKELLLRFSNLTDGEAKTVSS